MSRRTRRKYYKRKSGKWAPNIVKIASLNNASTGEFYNAEELAVNPVQTAFGVSQAFTCKNFEITFTIEATTIQAQQDLQSITCYVMFVPQGMNVTSGYYAQHPEYIMAYKYIGSPTYNEISTGAGGQQFQPIKIRSRLSRKLQTGDSVVLFVQGSNEYEETLQYKIDGIVRWWSKAN